VALDVAVFEGGFIALASYWLAFQESVAIGRQTLFSSFIGYYM